MTGVEYAKHLGVNKQRISKLEKDGVIVRHNGKFDPVLNDTRLAQTLDPAYDQKRKIRLSEKAKQSSRSLTFGEAKTLRETYMAALAKLEYRERLGKLVSREQVHKEAFETGRLVRDQFLNLPDRIAGLLAAETNQERVYQILTEEIQQALEALTGNQLTEGI